MKPKYYKVKSMHSSHKNQLGKYVGSFIAQGEKYHTLKFVGQEFRSYPARNLREYVSNSFSTRGIMEIIKEVLHGTHKDKFKHIKISSNPQCIMEIMIEALYGPHKDKFEHIKLFNFKDKKSKEGSEVKKDIFKILDYLYSEIEKLKKERR